MVQGSRGPTLGSGGTDGEKAEGDTRRFTGRTSGSSFPDTREEPRAASLGRWSQRHPEPRQDQLGGTLSWGRGSLHVQCAKRKRPETKRRRLGGTGDPPKLEPPEERGPVLSQEKRAKDTDRRRRRVQGEPGRAGLRGEAGARRASEPRERRSPGDRRGQTTPADAAAKPRSARADNGPGASVTTGSQRLLTAAPSERWETDVLVHGEGG